MSLLINTIVGVVFIWGIILIYKELFIPAYYAVNYSDYSRYKDKELKILQENNPTKEQIKSVGINDLLFVAMFIVIIVSGIIVLIYDIKLNSLTFYVVLLVLAGILKIKRWLIFCDIEKPQRKKK